MTEPPPSPTPISRAAAGWALIGFGGSFLAAAGLVARMFFLPSRGAPPLQPFSFDQPVMVVLAPLAVAGAVMLGVGLRLTGRRRG